MMKCRVLSGLVLLLISFGVVSCDMEILQAGRSTESPTAILAPLITPTIGPTATAPLVESPTPVPRPERPEDFEDYADTIVSYLNAIQGDEDELRAMLDSWRALRHVSDLLRVDVDDDGTGELLLVLTDPSAEYGINLRGELLVLDRDVDGYRPAYRAGSHFPLLDPTLIQADDLNRDGRTEIAFSSTSCGAHTCFTTVYIVRSGTIEYEDLTGGGIEMSYVEPAFTDRDDDGVWELVMHGGTIGSVGAGPQRERTEIYKWDGVAYVLSQTIYDYSNYLYFRVLDANRALLDGDYEEAAALYREAIDNPNLDVWMEERERADLAAFSRYKLSLVYLMLDEVGMAQAARDELLREQPDDVYAQVATLLLDAYDDSQGNLKAACEEVIRFAESHPETTDVLADYGYGNPTFTPEEVCPINLL